MTAIQFQINGLATEPDAERLVRRLSALDSVDDVRVHVRTGSVTLVSTSLDRAGSHVALVRSTIRSAGYELASDFGAGAVPPFQRWFRARVRLTQPVGM